MAKAESASSTRKRSTRPRKRVISPSFRTSTREGINHFDVPAETYGDGWKTGLEAARELLELIKASNRNHPTFSVSATLAEIGIAADEERMSTSPSRRGAACGMLSVLAEMITFAASRADFSRYIDAQLTDGPETGAAVKELGAGMTRNARSDPSVRKRHLRLVK